MSARPDWKATARQRRAEGEGALRAGDHAEAAQSFTDAAEAFDRAAWSAGVIDCPDAVAMREAAARTIRTRDAAASAVWTVAAYRFARFVGFLAGGRSPYWTTDAAEAQPLDADSARLAAHDWTDLAAQRGDTGFRAVAVPAGAPIEGGA